MIQNLIFFWLQLEWKMRPSDRMPEEDLGPPPSLGEYFTYLGLGMACMLVMWLLMKLHDKVEERSTVLSGILVVFGFAALLGAGFFLIPVAMVWYTWALVALYVLIIYIVCSISEHFKRKKYRREQEIENKKWESLVSFRIYSSQEKPDPSRKPIQYMLPGRLECKTENGMKSYFVNRKYEIEYNPYYENPSVGEWGKFQFRYSYYVDPLHKDVLTYMYFNLPDEVLCLVDIEHRYAGGRKTDMSGNQSMSSQVIDEDLPI